MKNNIVLLGQASDPQIQHMAAAVTDAGLQPWIVDTALFGTTWCLSYDPCYHDGMLHIHGTSLTFSTIEATYWHQYRSPINCRPDDAAASLVARDQASTLQSFFLFDSIRWINSIHAIRAHQCKPAQLNMAQRAGATIPDSYIGNEKHIARAFARNYPSVIFKPVRGGATARLLNENEREPDAIVRLLENTPGTLQEYIPGTNVRSYVFVDDVVSVQIDSDNADYREDPDAQVFRTPTPEAVKRLAVSICQQFGMTWCAIDWRRRTNGEFVFLEANPCPCFLAIENQTGIDLTGRLLKQLVAGRRHAKA
ncbi:ATP-grasp domain-containing protein [Alteromonas sp. H39]|uniref:ATP-grasp domain-containing protein n=1 Tax=Alteromonas sp. H39 TaxID=3389876 RepID=UPI0039E0F315